MALTISGFVFFVRVRTEYLKLYFFKSYIQLFTEHVGDVIRTNYHFSQKKNDSRLTKMRNKINKNTIFLIFIEKMMLFRDHVQ